MYRSECFTPGSVSRPPWSLSRSSCLAPQRPRRPRRHPPTSCSSRWPKPPTASDRWRPRDGRPPAGASGPAAPCDRPHPPRAPVGAGARGAALAVVAPPARHDRSPRAARAPEHGCGAGAGRCTQVPIESTGSIADLGLAQGEGAAYVVLLLSRADEAASLRESVFLPAVDAFAPLPEPSPTPSPAAYTEVEVTFPGGAAGVTLAGTLTIPAGAGPHPAVVLMTGSGPQDRDESLPGLIVKPFADHRRCACEGGRGRPALRRPRHRALDR